MKLNKFLVAAAAVAVLPLSVANAEEPTSSNGPAETPVLEKPAVGLDGQPTTGVNGTEAPALEKPAVGLDGQPTTGVNGAGTVNNVPEFKGGVNGTEAAVLDKPEYKLPNKGTFKVDKGTEAGKAQNGQKVLPKTSAVK